MKIIALTGGIAAGKDFIAEILRSKLGAETCVIFNADQENHKLLEDLQIINKIAEKFPESFENNQINRQKLGKIVFADKNSLEALEAILHPQIRKNYQDFLVMAQSENKKFVILNVPLLLEKGGYDYDFLIAIISDLGERKKRYILRELAKNPQNKEWFLASKFDEIVKNQIDDKNRIKNADFIIKNEEGGLDLKNLIEILKK